MSGEYGLVDIMNLIEQSITLRAQVIRTGKHTYQINVAEINRKLRKHKDVKDDDSDNIDSDCP